MQFRYPTNKLPHTVVVGISTSGPQKFRFEALDPQKPNTYYINHVGHVNGYREFELRFPTAPDNIILNIYNTATGNYTEDQDPTFRLTKFEAVKLKTHPIWLTPKDRSFIKFAQHFSESASIKTATLQDGTPSIYRSDDAQFVIDYYDVIYDRKLKQVINTPARIGHETGIIEASKNAFVQYTIPMRMIILLHEYSHKYKNPKNGLPIGSETGADIAALMMYLSLGYSPLEAHQAFLYVFNEANNEMNHKRYLIISDFIKRFERGEIANYFQSAGEVRKYAK